MRELGDIQCRIEVIHLAMVNETELANGKDRIEGQNQAQNHEENGSSFHKIDSTHHFPPANISCQFSCSLISCFRSLFCDLSVSSRQSPYRLWLCENRISRFAEMRPHPSGRKNHAVPIEEFAGFSFYLFIFNNNRFNCKIV